MSKEFRDFLSTLSPEVATLNLADAQAECRAWRVMWETAPETMRQWLLRIGDVVRPVRRNYTSDLGVLLSLTLVPEILQVGVEGVAYDSVKQTNYLERKILEIPFNAVMYWEWVSERERFDQIQAEREIGAETIGPR